MNRNCEFSGNVSEVTMFGSILPLTQTPVDNDTTEKKAFGGTIDYKNQMKLPVWLHAETKQLYWLA